MTTIILEETSNPAGTGVKSLLRGTDGAAHVVSSNITTKFREAFEVYSPASPSSPWVESKASGDLILIDGNAMAASYLVISKSPWNAGTVSAVETKARFSMPIEVSLGLHMSQRVVGQEFSVELADDATIPVDGDIAISTMTHGNALLTITTATAHGLAPGKRFQIRDCADNRFNYPSLVVASIPTPTQFTATAGPSGNLPNITATVTGGFVSPRPSLGYATNGTSMVFENATATNASFYIRSEAGDALPSGTALGNHSVTILTTASVQAVNTAYAYAFQPTDEYRLTLQADRVQWSNVAIDAVTQSASLVNRNQVVPDPSATYKLRIRASNAQDLSRPVGKIISAVKSGTTTATITLDRDHGLATGALVTVYGIRDQAAAAFPNIATATAITGVPAANQIQIVIGTGTANTSYGGFVSVVNGGNLPSALGAVAQVAQSATLATLADGTRQLVLQGSANWAAPATTIGDYVEVIGVRDNTTGADLGVDGAWKIATVGASFLSLVPADPTMALPADFATINCGGGLIKRTDLRLSFIRIFDFERERVEMLPRPSGDIASATPVVVQGTPTVSFTQPALVAGTALVGDVGVQYRATASGASAAHIVAAASSNATLVKNAAGKVLGWFLANTTAAWVYVKLHNQATAPTAGSGVVRTIPIPPNGVVSFFSEGGITFTTGIGLTIVTGSADTDATAVTAGAVVGELIFA